MRISVPPVTRWLKKQRTLGNPSEEAFRQWAEKRGWSITKRGWPDFFCVTDTGVALIEVKPRATVRLKAEQYAVLEVFRQLGLSCHTWTPDDGLLPLLPPKNWSK